MRAAGVETDAVQARANAKLLRRLLLLAAGMFGFGFALVPLYDVLCDITGLNRGDIQALAKNTQVDYSRQVGIELVANVPTAVPLRLTAPGKTLHVHPGELTQVEYEVENMTDRVVSGQAIPSYGPQRAAQYFKKIECFCFREQVLQPREKRRLPIMFVLDANVPRDLAVITLSYTLYESVRPGG